MKSLCLSAVLILILASCEKMTRAVLMPNRCQTCEVINDLDQEVLATFDGCGADFVDVEDDATICAFSWVKSTSNPYISVVCHTWKDEDEDE